MKELEIVEQEGRMDFSSLMDLIRAIWPREWGSPTEAEMLAEYEKSHDPEYDIDKFAFLEHKRIGWYRYSRWPREKANHDTAHTLDIVVLPEYQGKGYGKALMRDMIEDCRNRGYKKLMSRTIVGNTQSIALHESTGFKEAFRKGSDIVWELIL